eukprot:XP_001706003.1 Hypothetical protein GL50803_35969 [Giardia lamblia ATCC 50803]
MQDCLLLGQGQDDPGRNVRAPADPQAGCNQSIRGHYHVA